jgi:glycosyltransferase involved in cell wall biosynthesis
MMRISVAVPHYNNASFIAECISQAVLHDIVDEVLVCDDASDDFQALLSALSAFPSGKVRVVRNEDNLGVHLNKIKAVSECRNEWVMLFDSDNVLTREYIDGMVGACGWEERTIYAPGHIEKIDELGRGIGHFDYDGFAGVTDRSNFFARPHQSSLFQAMLNTCNYLVHGPTWARCARRHAPRYDIRAISSLDSMTMLCDWIAEGNRVDVIRGVGYLHRIHPGSSYLRHMRAIDADAWTAAMYRKVERSARRISVCVPNYERHDLLVESFAQVIGDDRVSEVVIMDDCSPNIAQVEAAVAALGSDKVRLVKGDTNLGPFHNKARAVSLCREQFCVLLDSDNIIGRDYVDRIFELDWRADQIVCPEVLVHHPDNLWGEVGTFVSYSEFIGKEMDLTWCRSAMSDRLMLLMNTGNYFVPVQAYLSAFEGNGLDRSVDISDVGFFNHLFLRRDSRNHLVVCEGLRYVHRVHNGSFFMRNAGQSPAQRERLKKMIMS